MQHSLPLWASRLAVFDTESTGVDPASARIVSAMIALLGEQGEVLERYDWLLDPGVEIPDSATRVHGISTEIARASGTEAAVGVAQIATRLGEMVDRGFPLVIYNAPYDLSLLRAELERHRATVPLSVSPVLDPLVLDRGLDRYRKGKRTLDVVSTHYGVELGTAHDAGDDAIATGRILQRIAARFRTELPDDLDDLHALQVRWAAEQAASLQEYVRRVRDPHFTADGSWPVRH